METSRRARSFAWRTVAALALALAGMPARADPLPNASTSVFCSVEGNSFMDPLTCEFGGSPSIPSSASALAEPAAPFVHAEAQSSVKAVLGAGSSATALYWFSVEGPTPQQAVPLLMDFRLHTQGSDDALAIAKIIVNTSLQPFAFVGEACDGRTITECDLPATLDETIHLTAQTGSRQDSITLFAQAQAFVSRQAPQSASAFADPYLYIDPSFPDAHLYHVIVSPGVGNAPPVPEPAAAWLAGSGGLWLWWRCRRRRGAALRPAGQQAAA